MSHADPGVPATPSLKWTTQTPPDSLLACPLNDGDRELGGWFSRPRHWCMDPPLDTEVDDAAPACTRMRAGSTRPAPCTMQRHHTGCSTGTELPGSTKRATWSNHAISPPSLEDEPQGE